MNPQHQQKTRTSQQRRVIFEELAKLRTHPTANEIYEIVRKRLPKISLGTVYRNLEILSERGMIQKLELAGTQKRFDGITDNHYHARCVMCGSVEDVSSGPLPSINEELNAVSEFEVLWHRLEFVGICPRCKQGGVTKN